MEGCAKLLTTGKRRAPKGECHIGLDDLTEHGEGLIMAVVLPPALPLAEPACLARLAERFAGHVYLAAAWRYAAVDQRFSGPDRAAGQGASACR